jgi:hypothetical protein
MISKTTDKTIPVIYKGILIFNSLCTPDIPVNVVDPVNCSAIYELTRGKKRYEMSFIRTWS